MGIIPPPWADILDWAKEFTLIAMTILGFIWYRQHFNIQTDILNEIKKHNKREEERDFDKLEGKEVRDVDRD